MKYSKKNSFRWGWKFLHMELLNLHGAEENKNNIPRISLRYKIKSKNFKSKGNLIDKSLKN